MRLTFVERAWLWVKMTCAVLGFAAVVYGLSYTGLNVFGGILEIMVLTVMGTLAWLARYPRKLEEKFTGFTRNARVLSNALFLFAAGFGALVVVVSDLLH